MKEKGGGKDRKREGRRKEKRGTGRKEKEKGEGGDRKRERRKKQKRAIGKGKEEKRAT